MSWRLVVGVGLVVGGLGCQAMKSLGSDEAGAAPASPALAAAADGGSAAMPPSPKLEFAVDEEVAVLRDDGTFEVEASVVAVGGPIVYLVAHVGNGVGPRMAQSGWAPASGPPPAGARSAPRGVRVRVGSARFSETVWMPSSQVFAAPWSPTAHAKVGDAFYEHQFGNFDWPKCVITELGDTPQGSVRAKCAGSDGTTLVNRHDMLAAWTVPTLATLSVGDIVWVDQTAWAIIVAKSATEATVRRAGFPAKDEPVAPTRLRAVH